MIAVPSQLVHCGLRYCAAFFFRQAQAQSLHELPSPDEGI